MDRGLIPYLYFSLSSKLRAQDGAAPSNVLGASNLPFMSAQTRQTYFIGKIPLNIRKYYVVENYFWPYFALLEKSKLNIFIIILSLNYNLMHQNWVKLSNFHYPYHLLFKINFIHLFLSKIHLLQHQPYRLA